MTKNPNPEFITDEISKSQIYDGLMRAIPQYVLAKDRKKRFVWVSQGFCKFVNRSSDQIIGKTDFDLFEHSIAVRFQADDDKILNGSKDLRLDAQEEDNELKEAAETRTVLRTKVPILNSRNEVVGVLCTFTDVSEQRKRRDRMLKLFVHDAPRPLILVRDTYLLELKDLQEQMIDEESRTTLVKATTRIDESIEFTLACCHAYGLLSHTSSEVWANSTSWPPFSFFQIFQLILSVLKPNTKAKFIQHLGKNVKVKSDKYKIIAIVYCLVHNAIRATQHHPSPEVKLGMRLDGDTIRIIIEDNGPGVHPNDRVNIFKEGYSKFGSSGIGLYIVKRFAEEGGGFVMPVVDVHPEFRGSVNKSGNPGARFEVGIKKFIIDNNK